MAEQVPRNSDGIWRANRYSHAQTLLAQHNMRDAYLKSLEATNDLGNLIREMGGTPTLTPKSASRKFDESPSTNNTSVPAPNASPGHSST